MGRTSHNGYATVRLLAIGVILVCSTPPRRAVGNAVKWAELAEHLAGKSVPLQDVMVCDCPDEIAELAPSRVVAQIIENTFYLWQEYDIVTGEGLLSTCIVMMKPETGPLSEAESRTLLTASALWQSPLPTYEDLEVLDPWAPELNALARERKVEAGPGVHIERVIGPDDRVRVSDSTDYPWRTVCYLWMDFPDTYSRGTGCLVGPHMVLTCGHNVYDQDTDTWVDAVTIAPGQNQPSPGATVIRPYGTREGTEVRTNTEHVDGGGPEHDYGAILFANPFSDISTYMPLEFTASLAIDETLEMAGYPADVQSETDSKALWYASGPVSSFTSTLVQYTIDTTGGNSGSPIWHESVSSPMPRLVGVHIGYQTGGLYLNEGARLGAHNQALITEWMQWTPSESDDDYEENDTLATAYDLSTRKKTWLSNISGMGVQADEDWFKIEVTAGYERVLVDCRFSHSGGDIDMSLLDSSSTRVGSSRSTTDNEYIDCIVPGAGTYYIKVYYGNAGNPYDLWWDDFQPTLEPMHRFWSASLGHHFYTITESEKNKLVTDFPDVWTYEGVAYYTHPDDTEPGLRPVYRFWSDRFSGHFYTISEIEKSKLINDYSHVWEFEGAAFYAYSEASAPAGTTPVYRFWSDALGAHFYTTSESEKNKLINNYSHVWAFEGAAWYAYE